MSEPAADLAAAAALISSFTGRPLPRDCVVFGEIALSGDVRPAAQAEARLKEAAKLGFTRALVPAGTKAEAIALEPGDHRRCARLVRLFGRTVTPQTREHMRKMLNSRASVGRIMSDSAITAIDVRRHRGHLGLGGLCDVARAGPRDLLDLRLGRWRPMSALRFDADVSAPAARGDLAALAGVRSSSLSARFLLVLMPLSILDHRFSEIGQEIGNRARRPRAWICLRHRPRARDRGHCLHRVRRAWCRCRIIRNGSRGARSFR